MIDIASGVVFYIIAIIMLISAVKVITTQNLIHSVLNAFGVLLSTAGLYWLLNAEFLSMVQVLVYAGAVTILMLFVVMLTTKGHIGQIVVIGKKNFLTTIVAVLFCGLLLYVVSTVEWTVKSQKDITNVTEVLAKELFTTYSLPFEVASIVLLVSLIGAIILAGRRVS